MIEDFMTITHRAEDINRLLSLTQIPNFRTLCTIHLLIHLHIPRVSTNNISVIFKDKCHSDPQGLVHIQRDRWVHRQSV